MSNDALPSFRSSGWERTFPKLCFKRRHRRQIGAMPMQAKIRHAVETIREAELRTRRSQAELGKERYGGDMAFPIAAVT